MANRKFSNLIDIGTPASGDRIPILDIDGSDPNKVKTVTVTNLIAGMGDVVGPTSAVDNSVPTFDTTSGKLIQDRNGIIIDASAKVAIANDTTIGTNATPTGSLFTFAYRTDDGLVLYLPFSETRSAPVTTVIRGDGTPTPTDQLESVVILDGGGPYASAPTLVFDTPTGTPPLDTATGTATLTGNRVTSISVDTPGDGYAVTPAPPPGITYTPLLPPQITVFDRSPFGNDGVTAGNAIINNTKGKFGNGLSLDASTNDTVIRVTQTPSLQFTNIITVEAWIKPNVVGNFDVIISKMDSGTGNGWAFGYQSNTLRVFFRNNGTAIDGGLTGSVPTGLWSHVAFTYDGVNIRTYVNGILVGTIAKPTWSDSGEDLLVGNRFDNGAIDGFENAFDGNISEVKVYHRVLVEAEIRTSYLRGNSSLALGTITADKFRINDTTANTQMLVDDFGNIRLNQSTRIKSSGTVTLTGSIDPTASTAVVGVGTLFTTELQLGDKIIVNSETRTVTAITDNLNLTVDTAFTDTGNDTSPDRLSASLGIIDSSNVSQFIINDIGNVGIGITAPTRRLDISSTIDQIAKFDTTNPSSSVILNSASLTTSLIYQIGNVNKWRTSATIGGGVTDFFLINIANSNSIPLFVHGDTDFVGIGSNSANSQLQVHGSLAVGRKASAIITSSGNETIIGITGNTTQNVPNSNVNIDVTGTILTINNTTSNDFIDKGVVVGTQVTLKDTTGLTPDQNGTHIVTSVSAANVIATISGGTGGNSVLNGSTDIVRQVVIRSVDLVDGRLFYIKDETGTANTTNIAVRVEPGKKIDGTVDATASIIVDFGDLQFYSDGTDLFSMNA